MSMLARRAGAVGLAALVALAIVACGQGVWGALAFANVTLSPAIPWASPVMAAVLAGLYWILSGRAWPERGRQARRALLRWNPVSLEALAWSLTAGVLAIIAAAGLWIVLSQLTPWSPNLLPSTRGVPIATVLLLLATGSLAAPLSEEAAFRGYAQGIVERAFSPWTAVVIVSAMFALVHLTQGLFAGKLAVYFLAGLTFGAVARLTNSIIPGILVHVIADVTFFTLVWPGDATRLSVSQGGADIWFWIHVGQVAVFTPLSLLAFMRLAKVAPKPPGQSVNRSLYTARCRPAFAPRASNTSSTATDSAPSSPPRRWTPSAMKPSSGGAPSRS